MATATTIPNAAFVQASPISGSTLVAGSRPHGTRGASGGDGFGQARTRECDGLADEDRRAIPHVSHTLEPRMPISVPVNLDAIAEEPRAPVTILRFVRLSR